MVKHLHISLCCDNNYDRRSDCNAQETNVRGEEMKKLFVALLLVSTTVHAEQWLEANNNAGGKIILLQADCDNTGKGKLVLTTAENGQSIRGCWWYFAGAVQVVYLDGTTYSYPPRIFTLKEEK